MSWRNTCTWLGGACALLLSVSSAQAAISWTGTAATNWWFDPANWSQSANNLLPPGQLNATTMLPDKTDAQLNIGWNSAGEGVVYDPANDPFFAAAAALAYPTDSAITANLDSSGTPYGNYGPQHLYRLYLSRNSTNKNVMTIKSGDLIIESTTIIGRSGSTTSAQNEGRVNQSGGRFRLPTITLDLGNSEASGWGNGVYDYSGGTLEVSLDAGSGLRVGAGGSSGPSGTSRFINRNPSTAGHIRVWDYVTSSYRGTADATFTAGLDPDGTTRGVAYTEFHYANGGTRPIQVMRNLTLSNGIDSTTGGTLSSRLELKLDSAPTVTAGVPQNLGLFDVDFDANGVGVINGFGDFNNDAAVNAADQVFAQADGLSLYSEGSEIFADFGSTRYVWNISYTGNITWTNADDSTLDPVTGISGPGTGIDVVLMGLRTEPLAASVPGDYDGNGTVGTSDYTLWSSNFGGASSTLQNSNPAKVGTTVDASDYTFWRDLKNAPAAAAAVPEPAALGILALLALGGVVRRR